MERRGRPSGLASSSLSIWGMREYRCRSMSRGMTVGMSRGAVVCPEVVDDFWSDHSESFV